MGAYFDFFHITYYTVTILLIELVTCVHIVMNKHEEPASAVLWMFIVFDFPLLGLLIYIMFGINRIHTRGTQIRLANELMRSHKGDPAHKAFSAHYEDQKGHVYTSSDGEYPDFMRALDRLLPGTAPLRGNSVELLTDGTKAYPRMLEEIRKAESSIHLQSFIIMDDQVGSEILMAMEEKARAGIDVKIIYDRFGSMKSGISLTLYGKNLPNFQIRAFSPLLNFRMPWAIQLRNHRKLLVIDGRTAFMGGINISKDNDIRWSGKDRYIHDLHCMIRGPAVGELQFSFARDWYYVASPPPSEIFREEFFPLLHESGDSVLRVVTSGPGHDFEATEKVFMAAASTARSQIWIITPYFVPDKPLWKALCLAVARGVEVRVIVPRTNNHWYVHYASHGLYRTLIEAGVRIFEKEGSFSHAKAMLVDGMWAFMGSSNWDVRSCKLNFELDFVAYRGAFIKDLHQQFHEEFSQSKEILMDDMVGRTFTRRLLEDACSLLIPVL